MRPIVGCPTKQTAIRSRISDELTLLLRVIPLLCGTPRPTRSSSFLHQSQVRDHGPAFGPVSLGITADALNSHHDDLRDLLSREELLEVGDHVALVRV